MSELEARVLIRIYCEARPIILHGSTTVTVIEYNLTIYFHSRRTFAARKRDFFLTIIGFRSVLAKLHPHSQLEPDKTQCKVHG